MRTCRAPARRLSHRSARAADRVTLQARARVGPRTPLAGGISPGGRSLLGPIMAASRRRWSRSPAISSAPAPSPTAPPLAAGSAAGCAPAPLAGRSAASSPGAGKPVSIGVCASSCEQSRAAASSCSRFMVCASGPGPSAALGAPRPGETESHPASRCFRIASGMAPVGLVRIASGMAPVGSGRECGRDTRRGGAPGGGTGRA